MTAIYNTPEYKLASREMQGWAFTHKGNYTSAADRAKAMGVPDHRMVKVKLNNGEEHEVKAILNMYRITPAGESKYTTLPNGKKETVFMVKGQSPKGKTALFFTMKDFDASPDVVKYKEEVETAVKAHQNQHHEFLKAELVKSHGPMARKATAELPEIAKGEDAVEKTYDWFKKNGFDMGHTNPDVFKNLVAHIKKEGHIVSTWQVSSKADGWGHQTGTSAHIDFGKKKIGLEGWSSDD